MKNKNEVLVEKLIKELARFYNESHLFKSDEEIHIVITHLTGTLSDAVVGFLCCLVDSIQKEGFLAKMPTGHAVTALLVAITNQLSTHIPLLILSKEELEESMKEKTQH